MASRLPSTAFVGKSQHNPMGHASSIDLPTIHGRKQTKARDVIENKSNNARLTRRNTRETDAHERTFHSKRRNASMLVLSMECESMEGEELRPQVQDEARKGRERTRKACAQRKNKNDQLVREEMEPLLLELSYKRVRVTKPGRRACSKRVHSNASLLGNWTCCLPTIAVLTFGFSITTFCRFQDEG